MWVWDEIKSVVICEKKTDGINDVEKLEDLDLCDGSDDEIKDEEEEDLPR